MELRNCFWPTEMTILMPRMHGRLISRISDKVPFYLSLQCSFRRKGHHVDDNSASENFEMKKKKKEIRHSHV